MLPSGPPDHRRHPPLADRLVEQTDVGLQEEELVLGRPVQENAERILAARIVVRRQVDVQIALLAESGRPDAVVAAVVVGQIDDAAMQLPLDALELVSGEEGGRRLTEADEIHPKREDGPRFHDVDSGGLSLKIDGVHLSNRRKAAK